MRWPSSSLPKACPWTISSFYRVKKKNRYLSQTQFRKNQSMIIVFLSLRSSHNRKGTLWRFQRPVRGRLERQIYPRRLVPRHHVRGRAREAMPGRSRPRDQSRHRPRNLLCVRQPVLQEPLVQQRPIPVRFCALRRSQDQEARPGFRKRPAQLLRWMGSVVLEAHRRRGQDRRSRRDSSLLFSHQ